VKFVVPTSKKTLPETRDAIDARLLGQLLIFTELNTRSLSNIHSQAGVDTVTLRESLPAQFRHLTPAVGLKYLMYALDKTEAGWFTHLLACCSNLAHKLTQDEMLNLFAALILNTPAEDVDVANLHQLQQKTGNACTLASFAKDRAATLKKAAEATEREEARGTKSNYSRGNNNNFNNSRRETGYDNNRKGYDNGYNNRNYDRYNDRRRQRSPVRDRSPARSQRAWTVNDYSDKGRGCEFFRVKGWCRATPCAGCVYDRRSAADRSANIPPGTRPWNSTTLQLQAAPAAEAKPIKPPK
jgi:hypothetical protein